MRLSEFDYELPEELIAQEPSEPRDASRMLVVNRETQGWTDATFREFPEFLQQNDALVVNDTRVFPARLIGFREPSGGRVEILLTRQVDPRTWEGLVRPGRRLKKGDRISFGEAELTAEVLDHPGSEVRRLRFLTERPLEGIIDELGQAPLPPYIKRPEGAATDDRIRYQTIFAQHRGAIAAPTAGLHFTPEILKQVAATRAELVPITLHVGYGTFEPVRAEDIAKHRVASEWFEITQAHADLINNCRSAGGRVIAVGTTSARALESAADPNGRIVARSETSGLTIIPGYRFRVVDVLLTNFHLPRSSLLLLVSAFAGRNLILNAYRHAIQSGYRFYSYGDCMLIL